MALVRSSIQLAFFVVLGLSSHQLYALSTDKNQPIRLQSDTADFNDANQEYILTGNVQVSQGSIIVSGTKAVIVIDPEGFKTISVLGQSHQLAKFTQQLDGPNREFIDGEGELILYEEKNDDLFISGNAHTQKRNGARWRDKLDADKIRYDLYTEKYNAVSESPNKLTKSTLAPRVQESPQLTDTRIGK